ncbi:Mitochondrial inner membrane translocase complex, subunit Tim21 [Ascosphaera apis ARSEF 7405]|uniref:Mitochondrial import inner membrane translocase subunit Tim21 n=1 Tax=Ascosphaera apis ARSEF 7405 TaxID=392613 RepID=A0A167WUJ3_9EURO|nr:Mitochondrial inner membrane translocase complex, subunit Tim21 [Ascosphaera apis ARSEF 7405]
MAPALPLQLPLSRLAPVAKPTSLRLSSTLSLRSSAIISRRTQHQFDLSRSYATHKDTPRPSGLSRRRVTVTNDDGHLQWRELSGREKTARATQQTFNFTIIVAGALLTGTVFTLLYKEVFAPDSKTVYFNKVVNRIKEDPRCIKLLGDAKHIRAYGENVDSKWTRNRPIATTIEKDKLGRDHMKMKFYVTGPINEGTVSVHLIRDLETSEYKYWLTPTTLFGKRRGKAICG